MKVLVVVAHPDDEVLGVGGTLIKHRNRGDEIYICIMTKAWEPDWSKEFIKERIREQKKVDTVLRTKKRFNLDFLSTQLNLSSCGKVNKKVTEVIDTVCPDVVYTHSDCDLHIDHQITFNACMVALRPPRKASLICFETISETEWNNKAFVPNYWVNIKSHLSEKIRLFGIYKTEVQEYPNPRSFYGIRITANKRGIDVCMEYAEAFMVIKEYWI